jgi:hypothetical protein
MRTFKTLDDKVLVFLFDTKKAMNLMFFRISEFQESPHERIKGKKFHIDDFVYSYWDSEGKLDYFNYWEGHNINKKTWQDFYSLFKDDLTGLEEDLFAEINSHDYEYVICATEGDESTLNHELAHAKYTLNLDYKNKMVDKFFKIDNDLALRITNDLKKLYAEEVVIDETQAYFSTADECELVEMFPSLTLEEILDVQKVYCEKTT